jgi:DEAD/DEAH box helicase domain-containing protein
VDPAFVLNSLEQSDDYDGQLVVRRAMSERDARFATLQRPLPDALSTRLRRLGIERLYTHQVETVERLRAGMHTVVATGTASGKTLAYHLPVLEEILDGRTTLYLAPTKALAQDQLRQIERFELDELRADTYDGDTASGARATIRRNSNLVLTNPDMLHVGILPHHSLWRTFLTRLAFVVVDEAHVLRGIFGSHVALVLRRLRRVAARYGCEPTFAFASATIGNPAEHASALSGLAVGAVTDDGAPTGLRHFAFWNPPFLSESDDGRRRSSNIESSKLLAALVSSDARTLAFSKSRVAAELVAKYARDRVESGRGIVAYRAGYLAAERRDIEQGLQDGRYPGVSATDALELGIDVGGLDAVVLNGFPGTIASARQQAGRAGRAGQPSLAVVVPRDEPLDQYYVGHPNDFFAKPHEAALVNVSNPHILGPHVGCAAYELPLDVSSDSGTIGGVSLDGIAKNLAVAGDLRERRGRMYWARPHPPAPSVDIRSAGGAPFRIVERGTGRLVGTVDAARAFSTVHPGAIYLHQGETYRVEDLVVEDRVAVVAETSADEYTQAKTDTDLVVLATEAEAELGTCHLERGLVEVTEQVIAYQRRRLPGGEVIEAHDLDLPPQRLVTRAVWYTIPDTTLRRALRGLPAEGSDVLLGSLHAAEHAAIGILPVYAMCDRWDIGGLSTNFHPDTGDPTIFIYDGYPMGAGISDHAFEVAREHLTATRDHVERCPCASGCPACVQSPKCGNWNEPLHKQGAARVLTALLGP